MTNLRSANTDRAEKNPGGHHQHGSSPLCHQSLATLTLLRPKPFSPPSRPPAGSQPLFATGITHGSLLRAQQLGFPLLWNPCTKSLHNACLLCLHPSNPFLPAGQGLCTSHLGFLLCVQGPEPGMAQPCGKAQQIRLTPFGVGRWYWLGHLCLGWLYQLSRSDLKNLKNFCQDLCLFSLLRVLKSQPQQQRESGLL